MSKQKNIAFLAIGSGFKNAKTARSGGTRHLACRFCVRALEKIGKKKWGGRHHSVLDVDSTYVFD
jgi:hypothetical protein